MFSLPRPDSSKLTTSAPSALTAPLADLKFAPASAAPTPKASAPTATAIVSNQVFLICNSFLLGASACAAKGPDRGTEADRRLHPGMANTGRGGALPLLWVE